MEVQTTGPAALPGVPVASRTTRATPFHLRARLGCKSRFNVKKQSSAQIVCLSGGMEWFGLGGDLQLVAPHISG